MNRKRFTTALISSMMVGIICLGMVACKKKEEPTESTLDTSEITTTTTTTAPTTVLTTYSGPSENDEAVTWTVTDMEEEVMYVKVSEGEFLNVRKGPNTTYEKAASLTRGQEVTVVGMSGQWYKTSDGYYIYQDYLVRTKPE